MFFVLIKLTSFGFRPYKKIHHFRPYLISSLLFLSLQLSQLTVD